MIHDTATTPLLPMPFGAVPIRPVTGGLEVRGVSLAVGALLQRVSLTARPGTLTAVIGPSGAGKSTLARVIAGTARPTAGTVTFDGNDVHAGYATLRHRIGLVPQDDVVHGGLTVMQALTYAARLRLPGTDAAGRRHVIAAVLTELELGAHAATRVDRLSGGQRKRVSVAIELLTGPTLLVLDEPTTGLDPALDRAVMAMLRRLADAGRVVVVVTHSLTFLDACDQVLLLAPGGRTVYCGAPDGIGATFGATDWADVFAKVCADPERLYRRYVDECEGSAVTVIVRHVGSKPPEPTAVGRCRQVATLIRRQLHLLVADRGYLAFLVLLPVVVGLLPLTVVGTAGFNAADGSAPLEPKHVIALTSFAAVLMGTMLTARDLVGERASFRRERAAGLSPSAYLAAKIAVFGLVAAIQSSVLVLVVTAPGFGKPGPSDGAVFGFGAVELVVGVAATGVSAAVLGLTISAWARTGDQVIVLMAAALTAQLVLAGGFIPVTGRPVLEAVAAITPGRWGFAATASTADLTNLVIGIARDAHWLHTPAAWLLDIGMLAVLTLGFAGLTRWRLRLAAR